MSIIGQGLDRLDGRLKVTGGASYSAEHQLPRLAQAAIVQSTIANGSVASIDDSVARTLPGVLLIMTHLNAPRLPAPKPEAGGYRRARPARPRLCCRTPPSSTTASRWRWWWPTPSSTRATRPRS